MILHPSDPIQSRCKKIVIIHRTCNCRLTPPVRHLPHNKPLRNSLTHIQPPRRENTFPAQVGLPPAMPNQIPRHRYTLTIALARAQSNHPDFPGARCAAQMLCCLLQNHPPRLRTFAGPRQITAGLRRRIHGCSIGGGLSAYHKATPINPRFVRSPRNRVTPSPNPLLQIAS